MNKLLKIVCALIFFMLGMLAASFLRDALVRDIVLAFISFGIGALVTFLVRDVITIKMTKQSTGLGVSLVVTLMWVISIIAEIFVPEFTVSPFVHGIMGVIAAFFFKDTELKLNGK